VANPVNASVEPRRTFLILDDTEDNRLLTAHALRKAFPGSKILESESLETALVTARGAKLDAIVTDHHLGTKEAPEFMRRLRELCVDCPVVMVTANSDPRIHRRAYAAGAARVFFGSDLNFVDYFRDLLKADGPKKTEG
jgi:CheY-like chemotaxis protein